MKAKDAKAKDAKKVRDMRGVIPGRGAAGRANAVSPGRKPPVTERCCGFGDVGAACGEWLMAHDPEWRKMRAADAERRMRRENEADRHTQSATNHHV